MTPRFTPTPTETVRAYQAGGPDANGQAPERHISDGGGNPCRHCLAMIPKGSPMLVLAHRPFPQPQPYAELDRIVYGTGAVVATSSLRTEAAARFADPRVMYLHVRSARNNCFQCRMDQ